MANPRLDQIKRTAVELALLKGTSDKAIMKKFGVSAGTISNIRQGYVSTEARLQAAERREKAASRQYRDALREIDKLQKQLDLFVSIKDKAEIYKPIKIQPKHGGRGEAIASFSVADWHYDEIILPAAVNGVNEFNPHIAHKRVQKLYSSAASLVDMCRSRSKIDTIIMYILGDLFSGYIHEELKATNAMTPPEAALKIYGEIVSGLEFLQKETKAKEIIVPCVCGNHTRITQKTWYKRNPETSLEWLIYNLLARHFLATKNKVVRVMPPQGSMVYITVYGKVIRIFHGDDIRYQGGVGGVHIPLRKALDNWNTYKQADYNILGHWHIDLTGEDYRISGSLIGYNEYAMKRLKARFSKPSQAFEIIHPRYGVTARFPILLE